MTITKPGIYTIPAEEYHADPCPAPSLSASMANILLSQSPLHAWTAHPKLNPAFLREEEDKFNMGTAVHRYFLEGQSDNFAIVDAKDWRTKIAQDQKAAARAEGKVPLLTEQWERVQRMAEALTVQIATFSGRPFTHGKPEQTLVWREGGIWCRARLDWLRDDYTAIEDLKTTGATANPEAWTRGPMFNLGFDFAAAFYRRGLKAVTGKDAAFRFIVIEDFEPHAAAPIAPGPDVLAFAETKIEYALKKWGECLESGTWEGYPTETMFAELPPWLEARWVERQARDWRPPTVDDGRPIEEQLAGMGEERA